jgi:hypothetical protein
MEQELLTLPEHQSSPLVFSGVRVKTTISRNLILEDANGHTMNAMKVFSESIKYLKHHFVETIESRITDLVETDIHWAFIVCPLASSSIRFLDIVVFPFKKKREIISVHVL